MYEHDLAERLGMTVDELEGRMSLDEFTRWYALDVMRERERKKKEKP